MPVSKACADKLQAVPLLQVIGDACAFNGAQGGAQQATSFQYLDVAANLIWIGEITADAKLLKVFTIGADTPSPMDYYVCRVKNSDGSYSAGALPALPCSPALLAAQSPGAVPPQSQLIVLSLSCGVDIVRTAFMTS